MNWLQKLFVTYEKIDLTNTDKIKGATQTEINHLESISGEVLPTYYRLFLETCGKKLPYFINNSDVSFEINALIDQYKMILEEDPEEMPEPEFIIVAVWDITGSDWVLNITTGEVYNRDEYGEIRSKVTDDFKKIIYQHAFTHYKLNKTKYIKSFGSDEINLNKKYGNISNEKFYTLVSKCLKKHNLSILKISDAHKQCASGNNIYFINTIYTNTPSNKHVNAMPFQIGADKEDDLISLGQDMNDLIGMK